MPSSACTKDDKGIWQISQLPEVESAFVAVDPKDGAIRALVGGFDFNRNKFNHVTQAWRQPGSSFKALHLFRFAGKGYGPGSVIADEPIVIPASQTGAQAWEPHNYDGKYEGPMKDAHRTGQVQEHGVDPPPAIDRHPLCPGLCRPLRLRSGQASALPDHGPGRRIRLPRGRW